jgi:phage portal protein BeeE
MIEYDVDSLFPAASTVFAVHPPCLVLSETLARLPIRLARKRKRGRRVNILHAASLAVEY